MGAQAKSPELIRRLRLHLGILQAPRPEEELTPDTIVGGEYRIVKMIGKGGMGVVYEAVLEKAGQTVALKMVLPGMMRSGMRQRFLSEMKAMGRLDHPGIVSIRHAGTHTFPDGGSADFFVMERIIGMGLREFCLSPEATLEERIRIVRDTALVVGYAHDQGVIHRDLKPANMLLRSDGRVLLFDFGLAAALQEGQGALAGAEGTIPYMAPEQAGGCAASPAADIYSLGAILYEILAGEALYRPGNKASLTEKLAMVRSPPRRKILDTPTLRPALEAILDKALALAPEERYSSAASFARALNRLLPAHLAHDPPDKWRPAAGAVIPGSDWVLEEKLGDGAHGQVWLGRCRPLPAAVMECPVPPPRVFKFCTTEYTARTLRREKRVFEALRRAYDSTVPQGGSDFTEPESTGLRAVTSDEVPGIVPLEAWSLDEPPYYVALRWIKGAVDLREWTQNAERERARPQEARSLTHDPAAAEKADAAALGIVCAVADALQFAAQNGVIHRDVSPANILVADDPGSPGGVRAWLIDFGVSDMDTNFVASQLNLSFADHEARMVGSLEYIAPELKRGSPSSTKSDIYSLGVVLYRLLLRDLTATLTEWKRHIADPFLREDLERCLVDDPAGRFDSAHALAASLRDLPNRRSIAEETARQAAAAESARESELVAARKAAYRKGLLRSGMISAVVIAVFAWMAWSSWQNYEKAWQGQARLRLAEIRALRQSTQPDRRRIILSRAGDAGGKFPAALIPAMRDEVIAALAMPSPSDDFARPVGSTPTAAGWSRGSQWIVWSGQQAVHRARLTPDGLRGESRWNLPGPVTRCAISDDGQVVAAVVGTGDMYASGYGAPFEKIGENAGLEGLAVHATGLVAVPGKGGQIQLFRRMDSRWSAGPLLGVKVPVLGPDVVAAAAATDLPMVSSSELLDFSPDGSRLLSGGSGGLYVYVWDTFSGALKAICPHKHVPTCCAWDPVDPNRWLTGSADGAVREWLVSGSRDFGKMLVPQREGAPDPDSPGAVFLDASPDGIFAAVTRDDGSCSILSRGQLEVLEYRSKGKLWRCGFTADSGLCLQDEEGRLTLECRDSRFTAISKTGGTALTRLAESPDGRLIAAVSDECVLLSESGEPGNALLLPTRQKASGVTFSPFDQMLHAVFTKGVGGWTWQEKTGAELIIQKKNTFADYGNGGQCAAVKVPGKRWISLSEGSNLLAVEGLPQPRELWKINGAGVISGLAAGRATPWFAVSRLDGEATAICYPAERRCRNLPEAGAEVLGLACSGDGRRIAERTAQAILVSDADTGGRIMTYGTPIAEFDSRSGFPAGVPVALSEDGSLVAVSSEGRRILVIDVGTSAPVAAISFTSTSSPAALLMTMDGDLVAGTGEGRLQVWHFPAIRQELRRLGLDWGEPVDLPPKRPGVRLRSGE